MSEKLLSDDDIFGSGATRDLTGGDSRLLSDEDIFGKAEPADTVVEPAAEPASPEEMFGVPMERDPIVRPANPAKWGDVLSSVPTHLVEGAREGVGGTLRAMTEVQPSYATRQAMRLAELHGGLPPEDESARTEWPFSMIEAARETGREMTRKARLNLQEATPENLSFWQEATLDAAKSLGISVPAVVGSVVTRSPVPAMAAMGVAEFGSSYNEAVESGLDPTRARSYAAINATLEAATEQLPLAELLKRDIGFFKKIVNFYWKELAQENVATITQSANEFATLRPGATFNDWATWVATEGIPKTTASTLIAAGAQGGAAHVVQKGLERVTRRQNEGDQEIARAVTQARTVDEAIDAAAAAASIETPAAAGPAFTPDEILGVANRRLSALRGLPARNPEADAELAFLEGNLTNPQALAESFGLRLSQAGTAPIPGIPTPVPRSPNVLGGHASGAEMLPVTPEHVGTVQGTPLLGKGVSGAQPVPLKRPTEPAVKPAEVPRETPAKRVPNLLETIAKLGGVNIADKMDIIGDTKGNKKIPYVGNAFTKKGDTLDGMAEKLTGLGWFTEAERNSGEATRKLSEMIRDEMVGIREHNRPGNLSDLDARMEAERARYYEEMEAAGEQLPEDDDPFLYATEADLSISGYTRADEATKDLAAIFAVARQKMGDDAFDALLERVAASNENASDDEFEALIRAEIENHGKAQTETPAARAESGGHIAPTGEVVEAAQGQARAEEEVARRVDAAAESADNAASPQTPKREPVASAGTETPSQEGVSVSGRDVRLTPVSKRPPAQDDLLGGRNETAQAIHDARAERERKERSAPDMAAGPGDLFSDKGKQADIEDVRGVKDRRRDTARRKAVSEMSHDELRRELLTDPLTGLPNRRAYEEAAKKPVQVAIDVDSLKWVNDNLGHEAGDQLLKAMGQALAESGLEAYHISGDEFMVQGEDQTAIETALEDVTTRLDAAELVAETPDGSTVNKRGVHFSYGIGATRHEADQALNRAKQSREAQGLRAPRGQEPPGVERTAQGEPPEVDQTPAEEVDQTPSTDERLGERDGDQLQDAENESQERLANKKGADRTGVATGQAAPSTDVNRAETDKAVTTPKPVAGKIEDFGETIEGARKHYAEAYRDRMREALETDIAAEPLSKSWPEPEYDKLLEAGADPWVVAFVHASRDEIPPKPRQSWKLRGWVEQVRLLRDIAHKILDGTISKERVQEKLGEKQFARLKAEIGDRAELYQAVGHGQSLKGVRVSQGSYSMFQGVEYKPAKIIWTVEKKAAATAFSNWPTTLASGDSREEAIANFKQAVEAGSLEIRKPADKEVSFTIYSYRRGEKAGRYYIGKKIGKEYVDLESFDDAKAARKYLAEHRDELVAKLERLKQIPNERKETNDPRVGVDHRNGADVTPEQFSEAFGFRGVQFGNYVEGAKRQSDLNEAYDALMDLAGVLGIPPRALSLNGELGLAFGARGTGGKDAPKAHYEPGQVVINLTKKSGAGSLAHEWWHALDNYFSRMRKDKEGYLTEKAYPRGEGVRPEMVEAFTTVIQTVNQTGLKERSHRLDKTRTKPYWSTGREMTARAFESYIIEKLRDQGASNDYLANIVSQAYWDAAASLGLEKEGTYPYPEAAEIPAVRAAFDGFFRTVETKETDDGDIALFSLETGDFAERVDAVLDGRVSEEARIDIGETPAVLRAVGLPDMPLATTGDVIDKVHYDHGLTREQIRSLPELLADPVMVFESDSRPGTFVTVLEPTVGGRPLLAIVQPDRQLIHVRVNFLASAYGKDNARQLERWVNAGLLRYRHTEKSPAWQAIVGVRFPERLVKQGRANKVLTEADVVKGDENTDFSSVSHRLDPVTAPVKRFTAKEIEAGIAPIVKRWKNAPPVHVVQRMEDLPSRVYLKALKLNAHGIRGAFVRSGGQDAVYLVADNMPSVERAQMTLLHEVVGHYGLRGAFGKEWESTLRRIYLYYGPSKLAYLKEAYKFDFAKKEDQLKAADEHFARLAERYGREELKGRELTFFEKIVLEFKNLLRRLGFTVKMGRAEWLDLANAMNLARQYVEGGTPGAAVGEGTRFAVDTDTEAFRRWFGASKVVDEQGKPLVVYHATTADFDSFKPGGRDPSLSGPAIWFSARADYQPAAHNVLVGGRAGRYREGANVIPAYVKIDRPLIVDATTREWAEDRYGKEFPYLMNTEVVQRLRDDGYDGVMEYSRDKLDPTLREVVVFRPEQIKSAIGNISTYDPDNTDIRFSADTEDDGVTVDDLGLPAYQRRAKDWLFDWLKTQKKVNLWSRSVGSMYHLAHKVPIFKPVFDTGQNFLADTSRIAIEAEDEAPGLFRKMGTLKQVFLTGRASDKDVGAIAVPIYRGTIIDEKVYSYDELRTAFGLTPKQIALYQQAIDATRKSLDDVTTSALHRMLGAMGLPRPALTGMARASRSPSVFLENVYQTFLKPTREDLADQIATLETQLETAGEDVRGAIEAELAAVREQKTALDADIANLYKTLARVKKLKSQGYFPLMRFGKYSVDVVEVDESGRRDRIAFMTFEHEHEANAAARALREEYPDAEVTQGVMSQDDWRLFPGLTPDVVEAFARAVGADESDLFQQYLKIAVGNRSAMKRLIHRKSVPGFSRDVNRTLATFILANARLASANYNMPDMMAAIQAIPKEQGDVRDKGVQLRDYLLNPSEEFAGLRGFLFFDFIGGSIASALTNLTQVPMATLPYLGQFGNARAAKAIAKWMRPGAAPAEGSRHARDLKRAEEEGIVSPQEVYNLMATARGGRLGTGKVLSNRHVQTALYMWGLMFSMAEQYNRRTTFNAAYDMALKRGEADPYAFAVKAVDETQFIYNRGNRPMWARGIGAPIFCVDDKTEALTADGWKTLDQLRTGDLIASFDMNTERLVWKPVTSVYRAPYDGEMVHVHDKHLDMLMTPNHRVVTYRRRRIEGRRATNATRLSLEIVEARDLNTRDCIPTAAPFVHDPVGERLPDALVKVLGWVVTEGCFYPQGYTCIYQNEGHKAAAIREALKAAGFEWAESSHRFDGGNADHVRFFVSAKQSKQLRELLPAKQLTPQLLMRLTTEQIRLLVDTMIAGDGSTHKRSGRRCFIQNQGVTLDTFQMALTMLGLSYSVRRHNGTTFAVLIRNGKRYTTKRSRRDRVRYSGRIWCPQVKDTATWVARRNGKPFITHNTFKQFVINYVELYKRLPARQKALMIALLIIAAGIRGLPFEEDAEDILDTLMQWAGYNWHTRAEMEKWAHGVLGERLGDFMLEGVSGLGLPIDVQARLGLGNLIPGTSLLKLSEADKSREAAEVLGVATNVARNVGIAVERTAKGDVAGAAKALSPKAAMHVWQAIEMATEGKYLDSQKRPLVETTVADAVMKGIGFNPRRVALAQKSQRLVRDMENLQRVVEDGIADRWARGIFFEDEELVEEAIKARDDWNEKNPDLPLFITGRQIGARVRQMTLDAETRAIRQAPRELRQRVMEEMEKR